MCIACDVAPFVGAWIETMTDKDVIDFVWSLPSWERGLKLFVPQELCNPLDVAPFVGAWIETIRQFNPPPRYQVAPFVGAWIETKSIVTFSTSILRRSLRGSVD